MGTRWVSGALLFCAAIFFNSQAQQKQATRRPNVILITIDTLRADYLGCYGNRRVETPVIDSLASAGSLFERAYCQVPMTPPSHASILTGTYPQTHGVRDFTSPGLRGGFPTLATILKKVGYTTAAFVSAYVLDSVWGLDQGFDTYHDRFAPHDFQGVNPGNVQRRAGETIDLVLAWLKKAPRLPYFLWVHLYDPHHDYNPPEPFRSRFAKDRYAGEVAYTDRELGRLIAALKARGEFDDSAIILTSDHGEAFGEHEEAEHGFFLYNTTIQVPLIFNLPGSARTGPARITSVVETVDIAPTVLQLTGASADSNIPMQGTGLLSSLLGKPERARGFSYSETLYPRLNFGWSDLASYTEGRFKYIRAPRPELYDIVSDPDETENVIQRQQAIAGNLRHKLDSLLQRLRPSSSPAAAAADPKRMEALRSLGYVAVSVPVTKTRTALTDPKDRVRVFNRILLAMQAADAGALPKSNELLGQVLRDEPDLFIAHYSLGVNRLKAGENEKALESFAKAAELNPGFDLTEINRASALARLGRVDEAIRALEALLRQNPTRLEARKQLALLLSRRKDYTGAIGIYRDILKSRPEDAEITKYLGIAQVEAEQYEAGADTLQRALRLGIEDAMIHNFLGIAVANLGQNLDAIASYRRSLKIRPDYQQARLNLAFALLKAGETGEAKKEFEQICQAGSSLCRQYRKHFP
jgi:arylsulfatase A-like enzyme/Flp pilus assembly protein TadD